MKIFKNSAVKDIRLAVVTRAKEDYELAGVAHPVLQEYAERCNADFIVINEEKINFGDYSYEILQCRELFDTYERILCIDTDVVITPWCPDLFGIVPYDHIGVIYEDKYIRKVHRRECIRKYQERFGDVGWKTGYINNGIFLFSKCHIDVLSFGKEDLWNELGYDDIVMGYNIRKHKYPVYELSYKYNHMSMFSEIGKNWLKSYIIHYAGRGFSNKKTRLQQMRSDLETVQEVSNRFFLNFARIPERLRLFSLGLLLYYRNLKSV